MKSRSNSFLTIIAIYLFSGTAGALLYLHLPYSYWMNLLAADVATTVIIFAFSVLYGNASVYDPYWSVFPVAAIIVVAIAAGKQLTALNMLHIAAICFWGVRLTANWAYTFHGLHEQDWRYTMLKERTGRLYPAVNLFGIHLVPTLIVYLCFLPAVYAVEHRLEGSLLSYAFVLLSVGAAVWQGIADYQMHAFRRNHRGEIMREGLWTYSRHPNYLGEIMMWWGIGLSVMTAEPSRFWLLSGALVNTMLFLFVSIPMADERQSRKAGFADYKAQTRMLLPIRHR